MADGLQHEGVAVRDWPLAGRTRLGARARSEVDRGVAVEKVIAAMHERIDRPFALEEMAGIAYLSPFYFNRVFRELTGVPPGRFHTALRIAAAKRLLLTSDLSVTEVCLEVGYQSLGTFTTHFHGLVGVSPRELRRLASEPWLAPAEMAEALASDDDEDVVPAVEGEIVGVDDDQLVFVGLFAQPYPQGLPIACTAITGPGPYSLQTPAEGPFHVAASAFAPSDDACSCLLPDEESLLVAVISAPVRLGPGRRTTCDLRLRPVRGTDPPILLALPLAAAERIARHGADLAELRGAAPA
jgi:AraC-like DNA-binding protein